MSRIELTVELCNTLCFLVGVLSRERNRFLDERILPMEIRTYVSNLKILESRARLIDLLLQNSVVSQNRKTSLATLIA